MKFEGERRFVEAIRRFDEENAHDPNTELVEGVSQPRELVYARRLTDWVLKLAPDASEALVLAARCQHICRWKIPRSDYEMTKVGYHRWRTDLKKFHAEKAGSILREVGYEDELVKQVQDLNLKRNFPNDPESRILEDALCLIFLQFQFNELASKTDETKVINALQKSWGKMTRHAQEIAMALEYPPLEKKLLEQALQNPPTS
jgi:hypothetical protein